jgi:iron(III) transport system ATP-binding protein
VIKLSIKGISCAFGEFTAVDNVSLDLADGKFVSLLGPSGCGKTTTLRMIAGFIRPTSGTIEMEGQVLSSPTRSLPPERRGMSMIFQSYAIWPNMTVAENVGFGLTIRRLPAAEINEKIDRILSIVHLRHLRDRYPAELSGGQQQRVALARAIVVEPKVLLLDEPLSNLDANLREEMRFEIRRLHEEFRMTTVYVTHDQAEAMATSDQIVIMNKGRIEQASDPFTLYNRPRTRFVAGFVGRTNFLEGQRHGRDIRFNGFSLPIDGIEDFRCDAEAVVFSVRPQAIQLHRARPPGPNRSWWVDGIIAARTYLGDFWDYLVAPAPGAAPLRVSASPMTMFDVG